jgi:hypothetical protein
VVNTVAGWWEAQSSCPRASDEIVAASALVALDDRAAAAATASKADMTLPCSAAACTFVRAGFRVSNHADTM